MRISSFSPVFSPLEVRLYVWRGSALSSNNEVKRVKAHLLQSLLCGLSSARYNVTLIMTEAACVSSVCNSLSALLLAPVGGGSSQEQVCPFWVFTQSSSFGFSGFDSQSSSASCWMKLLWTFCTDFPWNTLNDFKLNEPCHQNGCLEKVIFRHSLKRMMSLNC